MSDDYDDPDEPGGLWDPDAPSAPPGPPRPTLRAVPAPRDIEDEAPSVQPTKSSEETLVRLDQFRLAVDASADERRSPVLPRHWVQAAVALAAAAVLGAGALILSADRERSTHSVVGTPSRADAEQAAITRTVTSRPTSGRRESPARHRKAPATNASRRAAASQRRHSARSTRGAAQQPPGSDAVSTTGSASRSSVQPSQTRSVAASAVSPASPTNSEFSIER